MNYKDQIDEYFERFKDTERKAQMYRVVVHEMGQRYRELLNRGYTKVETEAQLANEIANLRGRYPVLNSLPRRAVAGADVGVTTRYVMIGMLFILSVGTYWFVPLFAFIPQFLMGLVGLRWVLSSGANTQWLRKRLFLFFFALMVYQIGALLIRFPVMRESRFAIITIAVICFSLLVFGYLLFRNHGKTLPKQPLLFRILNPTLFKSVDVQLYFVFVIASGLLYGGYFAFVALEYMFSTW